MHLGEKIKEIRRYLGLSQENIAHSTGSSVATISRIERGQAECSAEMLRAIKTAMGVDMAPLMDDELVSYHERLYVWGQLMADRRMDEALDMRQDLSVIQNLPYELGMNLLYKQFDIYLQLTEGKYDAASKGLDEIAGGFNDFTGEQKYHYYSAQSTLYFRREDYCNGLAMSLKCLELKEHWRGNLASVYYRVATNYSGLNRPFAAIIYLEEARRHHKTDDRLSILGVFIDHVLSANLLCIGELDRAKPLLDAALLRAEGIGRKMGRKKYIGMILHQLGIYWRKKNDNTQALAYFDRAFEFFWPGGLDYLENCYQKARVLIGERRHDEARGLIDEAMRAERHVKFFVMYEGLLHLMTLRETESQEYLQHTVIPYLISKHEYFISLDFCEQLEEQYKKNGNGRKPLEIAAVARDIYAKIVSGC